MTASENGYNAHSRKPVTPGVIFADVDLPTEKSLVSCLLHPRTSRADIGLLPPASDFSDTVNRQMFRMAASVIEELGAIDYTILLARLRAEGMVVDPGYFTELRAARAHPENIAHYGKILHDLSVKRIVADAGQRLIDTAARHAGSSDELLAAMDQMHQEAFRTAAGENYLGSDCVSLQDALADAFAMMENPTLEGCIPTGITDLDDAVGGFYPGEVTTIAGTQGGGKTSLSLQLVLNSAATTGKRWLIVSAEMTPRQVARQMLLMRARVNGMGIRRGLVSHAEMTRLKAARVELEALQSPDGTPHVVIVPPMEVTAASVGSIVRREKMTRGLDGFVVDYLQIMGRDQGGRGYQGTEESMIARDAQLFKNIARQLNVAAVVLSQLVKPTTTGRGKDGDTPPAPTLANLKGSGGIAAASDSVWILNRLSPATSELLAGEAAKVDCIIPKGRFTGTGLVELDFEPEYTTFCARGRGGSQGVF